MLRSNVLGGGINHNIVSEISIPKNTEYKY